MLQSGLWVACPPLLTRPEVARNLKRLGTPNRTRSCVGLRAQVLQQICKPRVSVVKGHHTWSSGTYASCSMLMPGLARRAWTAIATDIMESVDQEDSDMCVTADGNPSPQRALRGTQQTQQAWAQAGTRQSDSSAAATQSCVATSPPRQFLMKRSAVAVRSESSADHTSVQWASIETATRRNSVQQKCSSKFSIPFHCALLAPDRSLRVPNAAHGKPCSAAGAAESQCQASQHRPQQLCRRGCHSAPPTKYQASKRSAIFCVRLFTAALNVVCARCTGGHCALNTFTACRCICCWHSKTHSFQVEWPDFVWTAGRQIEQRCNVEIDNIGPIEAADLVLNTQVSTAPTCGNSAAMHSPPGGEA